MEMGEIDAELLGVVLPHLLVGKFCFVRFCYV